jgi:hypothetical protein
VLFMADAGRPSTSPGSVTPPRRPDSVRRTTTHDCTREAGLDGPVRVRARGRDLHTDPSGQAAVLATAELDLHLDFADGVITELAVDPELSGAGALVGRTTHRGFRAALEAALPEERHSGSVRWQLLDDLPMTVLLSGRVLRAAGIGLRRRDPNRPLPVDICAGWAEGGALLAGYSEFGPPFRNGPPADDVESGADALGWHEQTVPPAHATRRRRRLDVWLDDEGGAAVDCFFRDSHVDGSGLETVVHEYTVRAAVDPRSLRVVACDAIAGELPYPECPRAAASAGRLVDASTTGLRPSVLADLTGPSTCTHLNDALRSLEDVGALLRPLGR